MIRLDGVDASPGTGSYAKDVKTERTLIAMAPMGQSRDVIQPLESMKASP